MSFLKKIQRKYKLEASLSKREAVQELGIDEQKIDYAIPQSFFDQMLDLFPGQNWAGVWSYEQAKVYGEPRPLTKKAQEMLKKYNSHHKTRYPTDHKVLDY